MAARLRTVVWRQIPARTGLDEVIEYIARDSRDQALRVLELALETASTLDNLVERGRVVPELDNPNVRELFVLRYRLIIESCPSAWSSRHSFIGAGLCDMAAGTS